MKTPVFCIFCHQQVLDLFEKNGKLVGKCNCPEGVSGIESIRGHLEEGFIYCIGEGDSEEFVKIGYTKNQPSRRVSDFQTGNPRKLKLIGFIHGDMALEALLHNSFEQNIKHHDEHKKLNKNRIFFREWYYNKGLVNVLTQSISFLKSKKIGNYKPENVVLTQSNKTKHVLTGPWVAMGISESTYYRRGFRSNRKRGRKPKSNINI